MSNPATVAFVRRVLCGKLPLTSPGTETEWRKIFEFTSSHFVLPAFADRLLAATEIGTNSANEETHAARQFLEVILENNQLRNAFLLAEVKRLGTVLSSDAVEVIALKGAAFLVDADTDGRSLPWRFMSDIDLLVPKRQLAHSVGALEALGYVPVGTEYDPRTNAHAPPLVSPCGQIVVELHDRLFDLDAFALPVEQIWSNACRASANSQVQMPGVEDRLHHLIAHAQLHNRQYMAQRLILKDVLDFQALTAPADLAEVIDAVLSRFPQNEQRQAARAFIVAAESFLERPPTLQPTSREHSWAKQATARLGWSRVVRTSMTPVDSLRLEAYRLRNENGHAGRRLRQLTRPAAFTSALENWRYKTRQRLWS